MAKEVYVKREVADEESGELREEYVQVDLEELISATWKDPGRGKAMLDRRGHEILNPIPMAPPVGYKKQPSLFDQMRAIVRQEREALLNMDPETIEEADDFEVDDDPQPSSRWENDQEPSLKEIRRRVLEKGYVYNRATGQYEMPVEAPEISQEGGHPKGRSGAKEGGEAALDGLEGVPSSKKPRAPRAASKAPDPEE